MSPRVLQEVIDGLLGPLWGCGDQGMSRRLEEGMSVKEDLGNLQPHLCLQQGDKVLLGAIPKDQKGPGNSQHGLISTFRSARTHQLLQDSLVLVSSSPLFPPAPGFIFTEGRPTTPAKDVLLQGDSESHVGPYVALKHAS